MKEKQLIVLPSKTDFGYIEYFKKAMNHPKCDRKQLMFMQVKFHEAQRDYHTPGLKPFNHLIHIDEKPNLNITEAKWELYKVSISFRQICKS